MLKSLFPYTLVSLEVIARDYLPHTTYNALRQYVLNKPSLYKMTHKKNSKRYVAECDIETFLDEYHRLYQGKYNPVKKGL